MTFLNYIRELPRLNLTIAPLSPCPAQFSELQFGKGLIVKINNLQFYERCYNEKNSYYNRYHWTGWIILS